MYHNIDLVPAKHRTSPQPQTKRNVDRPETIAVRYPLHDKTSRPDKSVQRSPGAAKIGWPKSPEFVDNEETGDFSASPGSAGPPNMHLIAGFS